MKTAFPRDIYHIYELEARDFNSVSQDYFWKNLFQAGGIFVFLVFIVFFMVNFRFISAQLADWYEARNYDKIYESLTYNNNSSVRRNIK